MFIAGDTLFSKIALIIALCIAGADIIATLFALFYQRVWFPKVLRPKYDPFYEPSCSIVIPCKGTPKDFKANLTSFLNIDYKKFNVIFAVESDTDPAVPVIRSVIEGKPNASIVVAGHAVKCCQKNHNMLAAIARSSSEALVFADSDIGPTSAWLKEMLLPLSDPKVTVTSGFRWLHPQHGTFKEQFHSYINIFLYILFSVSSFVGAVGLWGGSMAIRRKDFDELQVAKRWAETGVDDMSLSQIIYRSGRHSLLVPTCLTHTGDLIRSVRAGVRWLERQVMYLKAHFFKLWLVLMLPFISAAAAVMLLPLIALVISLVNPSVSFRDAGGGAGLTVLLGEYMAVLLYPTLGPMPKFGRFLLLQPVMRLTQILAAWLTVFTTTIIWSRIEYRMRFDGTVAGVRRVTDDEEEE